MKERMRKRYENKKKTKTKKYCRYLIHITYTLIRTKNYNNNKKKSTLNCVQFCSNIIAADVVAADAVAAVVQYAEMQDVTNPKTTHRMSPFLVV